MTDGWGISCKIALRWMPLDLTDDKSTLVQVMAWCRQATSHYLSQCWPRFMSPYGVTRPQWVNSMWWCNDTSRTSAWLTLAPKDWKITINYQVRISLLLPMANEYTSFLSLSLRPHLYMCQYTRPSLLHIMACCLFGAKLLSEPKMPYCQLDDC